MSNSDLNNTYIYNVICNTIQDLSILCDLEAEFEGTPLNELWDIQTASGASFNKSFWGVKEALEKTRNRMLGDKNE